MYELVQIRNFWFDIDRNGKCVAHAVRRTDGTWDLLDREYKLIGSAFTSNKAALKWYKTMRGRPSNP